MPGRGRIRVLATGGTIATTTDPATGRSSPTIRAGALAATLGDVAPDFDIEPLDISDTPSWRLDPAAMADIAIAARDAARQPEVRGVVVIHGTTTLEYTAFLADLVLDVDTPVVLTGAMRRADQDAPDGPGNLRDAIVVAASDSARGAGALVVFAGRIIAAGRAWKARRVDLEAFVDLGDELGRVVDGRIEPSARLATIRRRAQPLAGRLDSHVELVKVAPGMSDWPFRALPEDTRGLVVEALPGVGGIPPGMIEGLAAVARRMPVVIASRAPYGQLPEAATGGTGEPLRDVGLLSAGPLSAEQAYLLLMAVLGETEPSDVATRFASAAGNATSS